MDSRDQEIRAIMDKCEEVGGDSERAVRSMRSSPSSFSTATMIRSRWLGFLYTWCVEDEVNDKGEKELQIRGYGLSRDASRTWMIHVKGFRPWMYVELEAVATTDRPSFQVDWTSFQTLVKQTLMERTRVLRGKTFYLSYKKKLYGEEGREFPFWKIRFQSEAERRTAFYQLNDQILRMRGIRFRVRCHEQTISPLLQLLVSKSLPSCGWIQCSSWKSVDQDKKFSRLTHEWEVHYEDLAGISDAESLELGIPSPGVMSFDLEVYSSNPMRMPSASIPEDCIFQISVCVQHSQGTSSSLSSSSEGHHEKEKDIYLLFTLRREDHYPAWTSMTMNDTGAAVEIRGFASERDLLMGWIQFLRDDDTIHVCIGYNIFGFDLPYVIERCRHHGILHELDRIGFPRWKHAPEKKISWSSTAYSCQEFHFLDTEGRLWIDLLPVVRRDYKFGNYRLKTVSSFFLGETKDPLTALDIFRAYEEGFLRRKERREERRPKEEEGFRALEQCGHYCVQDSKLVLQLFSVLNLWIGLSEMARICNVSVMDLFTKGQQIKVYSQIVFQCFQDNRIVEFVPKIGKEEEESLSSYTGAYVFPPTPGIYDWVIPFDFSSLYPTTIIAYNIDYSTFVKDESSVRLEDCHVIEWDDHQNCGHESLDPGVGDDGNPHEGEREKKREEEEESEEEEMSSALLVSPSTIIPNKDDIHKKKKKKDDKVICQRHRYLFKKSPPGVIPRLLIHLLNQRAVVKRRYKECSKEDTTRRILLDKQQLAYKLSANSAYGIMGFRKGYLPFPEGAMSVTAMGRSNIQMAAKYVQTHHQAQLIYGDSVTPSTPLWMTRSTDPARTEVRSIADWFESFLQTETSCPYPEFKPEDSEMIMSEEGGRNKERIDVEHLGWSILSASGWTRVKRMIRHATKKRLFRVHTTAGSVEVTEDHSLVLSDGRLCSPLELQVHKDVCRTFLPQQDVSGIVAGSSSSYSSCIIPSKFLLSCSDAMDPSILLREIQMTDTSILYFGGSMTVFQMLYFMFLPTFPDMRCYIHPSQTGVSSPSSPWEWILHPPSVCRSPLGLVYRVEEMMVGATTTTAAEMSQQELQFVYDVETEDGTFHAGIGSLIVKNTDSIYCHFADAQEAQGAWKQAKQIETEFLKLFPSPMKLVFEEKVYRKFLILTKKRYMALTCNNEHGDTDKDLTIRGVLLARRDNCLFLRQFYQEIVDLIMDGRPAPFVLQTIQERILRLFQWHPEYSATSEYFVVSKTLNRNYKVKSLPTDPDKWKKRMKSLGIHYSPSSIPTTSELEILNQRCIEETNQSDQQGFSSDSLSTGSSSPFLVQYPWLKDYLSRSLPAHVQLALKMKWRGRPVEPGSRIEFLVIRQEHEEKDAKLFDKLEDPEYFQRHRSLLRLDRLYYTKLLSTSLDQLLAVSFPSLSNNDRKFAHHLWESHYQRLHVIHSLHRQFAPSIEWIPPLPSTLLRLSPPPPTLSISNTNTNKHPSSSILSNSKFKSKLVPIPPLPQKSNSSIHQTSIYDFAIFSSSEKKKKK